jgi:hypothetical protein
VAQDQEFWMTDMNIDTSRHGTSLCHTSTYVKLWNLCYTLCVRV